MMSSTLHALLILMAVSTPPMWEVDGIRIEASIASQVFAWDVTNGTDRPITGFHMQSHHSYDQTGPPGWEVETGDGWFRSWTTDPALAIRPGRTGRFTARTGSRGATLRLRPGRVELDGTERVIEFPGVWGPGRHPPLLTWLVVGTLIGVTLLHAALLRRADRRRLQAEAAAA